MTAPVLPALSVRQPWASAIAGGAKTVENRSYATRHRGLVAIHAGLRWDPDGVDTIAWITGTPPPARGSLPTGAVVAVATLTRVCWSTVCDCGPWAQWGAHHWHLADAYALPAPVACSGRLGLWPWLPEATATAVMEQLKNHNLGESSCNPHN